MIVAATQNEKYIVIDSFETRRVPPSLDEDPDGIEVIPVNDRRFTEMLAELGYTSLDDDWFQFWGVSPVSFDSGKAVVGYVERPVAVLKVYDSDGNCEKTLSEVVDDNSYRTSALLEYLEEHETGHITIVPNPRADASYTKTLLKNISTYCKMGIRVDMLSIQ